MTDKRVGIIIIQCHLYHHHHHHYLIVPMRQFSNLIGFQQPFKIAYRKWFQTPFAFVINFWAIEE